MSEQQVEKTPHKDGQPWTNVRVFSTFHEANVLRKNLQQDATQQVKVKKQLNASGEEVFVVKKRKDPSLVIEEHPVSEKKKNKK